jgi:Mg-chelatase subunit ChlD
VTDPGYRHLVLVVDRSGSMEAVEADMNGGIRKFAAEQAAVPKRTTLSLYQFDTQHDEVRAFAPLTAGVLDGWRLVPRGGTALLDAVGTAVQRTGEALSDLAEGERPGEVVVMIVTDGHENSSREYTLPQVKDLITRQREQYGWAFMFLGADQDAFDAGSSMGVSIANSGSYRSANANAMWAATSASVTRGTTGQSMGYVFTAAETDAMLSPDGGDETVLRSPAQP